MLEAWLNGGTYRQEQMKKVARQLGLSYESKDEFGLINLLKDFRLFNRGRRKRITHILGEKTKWQETDFRLFDYKYTIRAGKHSRTYRQTVFFVQSKKLGLPQFYMKPEHFFHKIGHYLGIEDIDFEEYPEFSDQYWLKGTDEGQIRNAMSDKVLHFFTIEKNWSLEALNYYLIFYKKNEILPARDIGDFYQKGKAIVDLFVEEK